MALIEAVRNDAQQRTGQSAKEAIALVGMIGNSQPMKHGNATIDPWVD